MAQAQDAAPQKAVEYETVRISRPDGTVVTLRIPVHVPLQLFRPRLVRPAERAGAERVEGPVQADPMRLNLANLRTNVAGRGAMPGPRTSSAGPASSQTSSYRFSHPIFGSRVVDGEAALLARPRGHLGTGDSPSPPAVGGDDPTEWRTGRGWAPDDGDDGKGDYLSSSDGYRFAVLKPGKGWSGPTEDPPPIGNEDDPARDARVIARWTTVPYQTLQRDPVHLGVMAFHMNGIDRVEFSLNDGPWVTVNEPTKQPDTNLMAYVVTLDPAYCPPGVLDVRARIYPRGAGLPRVLDGAVLDDTARNGESSFLGFRAPDGWGGDSPIYVSPTGSDLNPGTKSKPMATITEALNLLKTRGEGNIRLAKGTYLGPDRPYGNQRIKNQRWVTIEADPEANLKLGDVKIIMPAYQPVRAQTQLTRWRGITFDFATISQFYYGATDLVWFDGCEWYDSLGWDHLASRSSPMSGRYYFTGGRVHDMLYGPTSAEMVRNTTIDRISGDVLQNSRFVAGCVISNVDGTILNHHTDLFQMFGEMDNVIVADLLATKLTDTQSLFLEPTYQSGDGKPRYVLSNSAFVRLKIYNEPVYNNNGQAWGGPPWAQLISSFSHVIFDTVELPNQRFMIRSDVNNNNQWWEAKNLFVRDALLHWASYDDYTDGSLPSGCTFENLRRSNGDDVY